MLFVIDVGNTNTVIGMFEDQRLLAIDATGTALTVDLARGGPARPVPLPRGSEILALGLGRGLIAIRPPEGGDQVWTLATEPGDSIYAKMGLAGIHQGAKLPGSMPALIMELQIIIYLFVSVDDFMKQIGMQLFPVWGPIKIGPQPNASDRYQALQVKLASHVASFARKIYCAPRHRVGRCLPDGSP